MLEHLSMLRLQLKGIKEFHNYTIHEMLKENAIRECIRSYVEKGELLKNEKLSLN